MLGTALVRRTRGTTSAVTAVTVLVVLTLSHIAQTPGDSAGDFSQPTRTESQLRGPG